MTCIEMLLRDVSKDNLKVLYTYLEALVESDSELAKSDMLYFMERIRKL